MALLDKFGDPFTLRLFDYDNPENVRRNAFNIVASNIIDLLAAAAGVLFVVMFVIGGIFYIASAGNPQRVEQGKKYLGYAVGGLLMVILAEVLTRTVRYLADQAGSQNSLADAIQTVLNWLLAGVGMLAVLFIIIGGIRYIVSRGNTDQVNKAKQTLTYAIIGLLAVIFSEVILNLIIVLVDKFV
jgi:divalent metal cation (Fe/Co/Zn/Cd) transporter